MKKIQTNRRLNISALRSEFKTCLAKRASLQRIHDSLWNQIKQGYNRKQQLDNTDAQIGKQTHTINYIISKLIKSGQMNNVDCSMARNYLQSEIARNQRIVDYWIKSINKVERGRAGLISSSGVHHTNTSSLRQYVTQKKFKIAEAQRLLAMLRR